MIQKDYISKNHSKFLIKYHVIFVCKYRKKLLIGAVEYDMKQIMQNISDLSDFNIEVMETDKDHIHMMICSEPKLSPLQIVRRLKQMSTTAIWKTHFGRMDILCHQSEMSVRKPSKNTSKTKGSCATPHFSSPKLKI